MVLAVLFLVNRVTGQVHSQPVQGAGIHTLKTNYLGGKNPRLHTDEILIALSSSAASNEQAAAAMHQLPNLKGCDVHSTVLLSGVDTSTLNRLGMYLTCDPVYEEEDRKYHKQ